MSDEALEYEVRKTVTVVFCDIAGSTALGERLDSESLREVMSRYFNEMQSILRRHGGVVEKFIGDAVMAVFGLPTAHEDDALRAVRAAFEMRTALSRLNAELEHGWGVSLANRTGVNTGEVVAGEPSLQQRLVTGDAVNLAARLEQAAPTGEVLLGDTTYRLTKDHVVVEPVEPLQLKGKSHPVSAYRLVDLGVASDVTTRRTRNPMVGRRRERAALSQILRTVSAAREGHMVVVIGPPGVGKSRMVSEFLAAESDRVIVLRGRCLSYGEGITLWPFAEAVRSALVDADEDFESHLKRVLAGIEEADEAGTRLGSLVGATELEYSVDDVLWAIRKLLQALARDRPVVLLLDDVQWGEPTFLDMVERIRDASTSDPIMILCLARPELAEIRSTWSGTEPISRTSVLTLEAMDPVESEELARSLLGRLPIPEPVLDRLVRSAEGNPLFVEEMVGMLVDDGLLVMSDHGWVATGDVSSLPIPPGIRALLATRLDALHPSERSILDRGSVSGQVFYRGAVRELCPSDLRLRVDDGLVQLETKDYVRPDPAGFAGEDAFRFRHILIRDAAYEGMLKRTRARLHEAFGQWLEARVEVEGAEYQEILGYHFEQAYQYLAELGPPDNHARSLAAHAAGYLLAAGQRARTRGDVPAAANLLSRADALWQGDDRDRVVLLIDLSEVLEDIADYKGAEAAMRRAEASAEATGDAIAHEYAVMGRLSLRLTTDPKGVEPLARAEVERMRPLLERAEDYRGLARLWGLRRWLSWTRLQVGASEAAAQEMLRYAELAGEERRRMVSLGMIVSCSWIGPTTVGDALRQCDSLLDRARGNRLVESDVRFSQAVLYAMSGQFALSRDLCRIGLAMCEEMGSVKYTAGAAQFIFEVEMMAGNPEAAERELRRYLPLLVEIDDRWDLPTNAGMLAMALYRQGRLDAAEEWSDISRRAAPASDVDAQSRWRRAHALILARRNQFELADTLSSEAVRLLDQTDFLHEKAQVMMERGEILGLAGRVDDAAEALHGALDLFERKGNVVGAADARGALAELVQSETKR